MIICWTAARRLDWVSNASFEKKPRVTFTHIFLEVMKQKILKEPEQFLHLRKHLHVLNVVEHAVCGSTLRGHMVPELSQSLESELSRDWLLIDEPINSIDFFCFGFTVLFGLFDFYGFISTVSTSVLILLLFHFYFHLNVYVCVCDVDSCVYEHVSVCVCFFFFFSRLRFFAFIEAVIEGPRMHDCAHVTPLYKHIHTGNKTKVYFHLFV